MILLRGNSILHVRELNGLMSSSLPVRTKCVFGQISIRTKCLFELTFHSYRDDAHEEEGSFTNVNLIGREEHLRVTCTFLVFVQDLYLVCYKYVN